MHVYILGVAQPELHDLITKATTGPLDQYAMPDRPAPPPTLRPPPWSRISPAQIEFMRNLREQQAQPT